MINIITMKYEDSFIRHWYQRVWNESNIDAINEMMHPDCIAYGLGEGPVVGVDRFRENFVFFQIAFP